MSLRMIETDFSGGIPVAIPETSEPGHGIPGTGLQDDSVEAMHYHQHHHHKVTEGMVFRQKRR